MRKFWIFQFVIGIPLLIYSSTLGAEPKKSITFSVTPAKVTQLLSQHAIQQVFQDKTGYLWINTQKGINRYDGSRLLAYSSTAEEEAYFITHDDVRQIIQDSDGTLWLATRGGGLLFYDSLSSKFIDYGSSLWGRGALNEKDLTAVFADSRGFIWIGSLEGTVTILNPVQNTSQQLHSITTLGKGSGGITRFTEDSAGNVYIGTTHSGVFRYSMGGETTVFFAGENQRSPGRITELLNGSDGRLWIGTENQGAIAIDLITGSRLRFQQNSTDGRNISSNSVNTIYLDSERGTWIGTDYGLDFLAPDKLQTRQITELSGNVILDITQDRSGTYWIGTYFGLYKIVKTQFDHYSTSKAASGDAITAFAESSDGMIWVGTYKGLSVYDPVTNWIGNPSDRYPNIQQTGKRIMSLNTDKHHLWLGYRSDGIKRINLETGTEKNFSTTSAPSNALRSNAISSIEPDANGDAWITTFGGGAARYDHASDKIINYTHNVTAKNSDQILTFYEDKSGTVWLGSSAGLSNLDSASHSLVKATPQSTDIELGESTVTAIHGDQNGNIWIGTEYEGLAVWPASHREKGEMYIRKARTNRRMPSSTIYAIEEDNNGFLWISTSNGLVRLDPGSMTIITFDYRDGLQDNEFNFGASFKDSNGFLYFGGNRGFNRFDPESIVIDAKPPQVVLTSATFADTRLGFDESYVQIDSLDLDYKDYFATFSFSALDYKEHSQIEYKYKLDNFDQDWVSIGNKQSIGFTNLPSGVYTLNIKASGTDGQWSDTGLKISLLMHPPPWLDWWAFSIYGALLVGLMALVRKYYDTYALKERSDQMALDMELTAENALDNLQEQIFNEQQLARNIHTHTSGMLNLLGQVFEQNRKFFNDPEITEVLLANQDRVQCLKHVEDNLHYLGDTLVVDFRCFVERMFDSLDKYDFGSTLQVVPVNDIIDISLPAQVAVPLSLIINEMFHNSLKHAYRDVSGVHTFMVRVKKDQKAGGWQVEVSDSGCGLPESINPLMPITSGMVLIAYCAKLLDAAIEVQRDKGTVFRIFVPRPAEEDYASTY